MQNEHLAVINELKAIASRMRERQELIASGMRQMHAGVGNLLELASEQGRDCVLAKTKLGKTIAWNEWLHAHVPSLSETEAGKYERLNTEQITGIRQAAFAFLPPAPRKPKGEASRMRAPAWEIAWGCLSKARKIMAREDVGSWPSGQKDIIRAELLPVVRALWPDGL